MATGPACGPPLSLSLALKHWEPPKLLGLCSHLALLDFSLHHISCASRNMFVRTHRCPIAAGECLRFFQTVGASSRTPPPPPRREG